MSKLMTAGLAGIAICVAAGAAASAQTTGKAETPVRPQIIQELEKCRSIANGEARLACFDAASAGLAGAIESKQVVVVEQTEVKKTKRSLFGFRLPDFSIFGDDDKPQDQQLLTTIARASPGQSGRWNITTAEGAVWQTTEPIPFDPRAGDALEIKSGALGSYFLKVTNKRAVRAKRIE